MLSSEVSRAQRTYFTKGSSLPEILEKFRVLKDFHKQERPKPAMIFPATFSFLNPL